MFPPAVMKDVEANTFDVKAWEEEAYHPSSLTFVSHKVELAGEIIRVIQNPARLVILVEERPVEGHSAKSPTSIEHDSAPWFAVTFKGSVEPSMLQTGNRLIVVGTTYRPGREMFGGAPRVLPHLRAQCLHIWNTEGVKNKYFSSETGGIEAYPPDERTICLGDGPAGSSPRHSQGAENQSSESS
jgi:starvation-inducible outer membrane lipoprotein